MEKENVDWIDEIDDGHYNDWEPTDEEGRLLSGNMTRGEMIEWFELMRWEIRLAFVTTAIWFLAVHYS